MTVLLDTPKVWVASLSDYNDGVLHGKWVNAVDADELWEGIAEVLASSPTAAKTGQVAEEHGFFDQENFGGFSVPEYTDVESVVAVGAAIEEHGAAFAAYLSIASSDSDVSVVIDGFADAYFGSYDEEDDLGNELAEEHIANVKAVMERSNDRDSAFMFASIEDYIDVLSLGESLTEGIELVRYDGGYHAFRH